MAEHTPGPWTVEPHSDAAECVSVVADYTETRDNDGRIVKRACWIAECDSGVDTGMSGAEYESAIETNFANAQLIAASPELLALAREASEIMTITYAGNFPAGIESFLVRAAKAIAKAEGTNG